MIQNIVSMFGLIGGGKMNSAPFLRNIRRVRNKDVHREPDRTDFHSCRWSGACSHHPLASTKGLKRPSRRRSRKLTKERGNVGAASAWSDPLKLDHRKQ